MTERQGNPFSLSRTVIGRRKKIRQKWTRVEEHLIDTNPSVSLETGRELKKTKKPKEENKKVERIVSA